MDLYHSWLYQHVLNTGWFIWTIVVAVFLLNIIAPILIWYLMSEKKIPFIRRNTEDKNVKK
ncbi:hypothetical protein EKG37_03995 [Robertmurraya yapensis]|uniref:Uncharacterized protein n=2 Tax=Bacillaceae TaxID=186817 RepID=A0A431WK56_9BACI|nr:hypothetical protein [Bacillus yapensis]RTR35802.1 hypothetical protein EKG37_03995 [Bacillus yapensis]TKS98604.1 hypothetical protein FAR12_03995 [Bacillus yapensis]